MKIKAPTTISCFEPHYYPTRKPERTTTHHRKHQTAQSITQRTTESTTQRTTPRTTESTTQRTTKTNFYYQQLLGYGMICLPLSNKTISCQNDRTKLLFLLNFQKDQTLHSYTPSLAADPVHAVHPKSNTSFF